MIISKGLEWHQSISQTSSQRGGLRGGIGSYTKASDQNIHVRASNVFVRIKGAHVVKAVVNFLCLTHFCFLSLVSLLPGGMRGRLIFGHPAIEFYPSKSN